MELFNLRTVCLTLLHGPRAFSGDQWQLKVMASAKIQLRFEHRGFFSELLAQKFWARTFDLKLWKNIQAETKLSQQSFFETKFLSLRYPRRRRLLSLPDSAFGFGEISIGFLWVISDSFGCLWISSDFFGFLWLPSNFFCIFLWLQIPSDSFGFQEIPEDSFGIC